MCLCVCVCGCEINANHTLANGNDKIDDDDDDGGGGNNNICMNIQNKQTKRKENEQRIASKAFAKRAVRVHNDSEEYMG